VSRSLQIGLALAVAIVALPLLPWGVGLCTDRVPVGLRLAAEPIDPEQDLRVQLERRARRWARVEVGVDAGGDALRSPTRAALGASVDVEEMLRRIRSYGRSGNPARDLPALMAAWSGAADLSWTVRTDPEALTSFVDDVAHQVDEPPQAARLSPRGRLLELSSDGAELNQEASVEALRQTLVSGRRSVRLSVERISSGVGAEALPPLPPLVTPPVLIARYSTDLESRGSERPRAHNVATAAGYLDGAIIAPHGRLSFNDRVQERSFDRGYRLAHVILDGEMVDGIGGGVCQVASTLHAAAFLGGLEIVDHRPHSRPSAYIPMGLDATVVWPNVDLVIANPFPFAVTVRARADGGQMRVELWGSRREARVDWHRQTIATEDWSDRFVEDPEISGDRRRVSQRGIRGFTVLRERTIHDGNGVHIEHRRIRYPPTSRVIRVAPGTLDPMTGEPLSPEEIANVRAIPDNPF